MSFQAISTNDLDDLSDNESQDFTADSLLMEDYKLDSAGALQAFKSYRTVLQLPTKSRGKAHTMRISSEETTQLHIRGVDYQVGPGQWQTFSFDGTGELTMSIPASGLYTPALRLCIDATADANAIVFMPDDDLHSWLSTVQGADLTSADNPLLSTENSGQANDVAEAIRQVAGLTQTDTSATKKGGSLFGKIKSAAKSVSKTVSNTATSAASTVAKTATSTASTVASATTSAANTVATTATKDANVVASAVSSATTSSVKFVITKVPGAAGAFQHVKGAVSFMVSEGGKLVQKAIDFEVTCRREALEVVHKILAAAAVTLEKAVAWLARKLGWADVLATKRVFENVVVSGLKFLENSASNIKPVLRKKFKALESTVASTFDSAIAKLAKQSLSGGTKGSSQAVDPHASWLHSKLKDHAGSGSINQSTLSAASGVDESANLTSKHGDNFQSANMKAVFAKLKSFASGNLSDISKLGDLLLEGILLLFKELAVASLTVVEALIEDVLTLVVDMSKRLRQVLTAKISIPFISPLYKLISGDDLTILDLLSLVIAAFVTPMYKLAHGGKAPFSQSQALNFAEDTSKYGSVATWKGITAILFVPKMLFEVWDDVVSKGATPGSAGVSELISSIGVMFFKLVMHVAMVPGDLDPISNLTTFSENFSSGTDPTLEAVYWLYGWIGISIEVISLIYSTGKGLGTELLRSEGSIGPYIEGGLGVIGLLIGVALLMERLITGKQPVGQSFMDFTLDIAEEAPSIFRFLEEDPEPEGVMILSVIEVFSAATAGILWTQIHV